MHKGRNKLQAKNPRKGKSPKKYFVGGYVA